MDPRIGEMLALELGFTQERVLALRQAPSFDQAVQGLEALKKEVKANYKKLAFKYHPDRNPGDAEAEAMFKALGSVVQQIEALRMERPRPQPMVIHFQYGTPIHVRPSPTYASTASSTSTTYNAAYVAFVRPV